MDRIDVYVVVLVSSSCGGGGSCSGNIRSGKLYRQTERRKTEACFNSLIVSRDLSNSSWLVSRIFWLSNSIRFCALSSWTRSSRSSYWLRATHRQTEIQT